MELYQKIKRIKAADYIGNGHMRVETHCSSAYPLHWHDYFEIEIITGGIGTHIVNGTAHAVEKGDAYLLTPVDFHEIESASEINLINVSFDETWLSEKMRMLLYGNGFRTTTRFEADDFERLVMAAELLQHECRKNGPCISQLLEYLLCRFLQQSLSEQDSPPNQTHMSGMKKAVAYIELHFREKISLERLSALSGYHPTYFSELFRKLTGETYIERLTSLRVNYAKALLANGVSVSEACFESGFGSLSNFLSVFKDRCGMTPSQYRKLHWGPGENRDHAERTLRPTDLREK